MPVSIRSDMNSYRDEPAEVIKLACAIAKGEITLSEEQETMLISKDSVLLENPANVRAEFWELLMLRERADALRWLDKIGLLVACFVSAQMSGPQSPNCC